MEKIRWCLGIKSGIEIVEPNENLSKVYIIKAENALSAAKSLKNNRDWEISSCYYSMYFALYSILMRIGIKCENHSCSIEFMNILLKDFFSSGDVNLLENSMRARIDAQYYADRRVSDEQYSQMIKCAPAFLVKCKETLLKLNNEQIDTIRKKIKQIKE
ncbi:HEPN domain-containing protein [Candidatus Woesearchaeota archaeon]|nr:HEPN domain-containing protein [Candidatus Woesearchaeota archaeon]